MGCYLCVMKAAQDSPKEVKEKKREEEGGMGNLRGSRRVLVREKGGGGRSSNERKITAMFTGRKIEEI